MNKTTLIQFLITIFCSLVTTFNVSSQSKTKDNKPAFHTLDSCNKCTCHKWHKSFGTDTTDATTIIYKYRIKRGNNCISDGYKKYHWITTKLYPNNRIKEIKIEKGWNNGFTGSSITLMTGYSDKTGKKLWKRMIKKNRGIIKLEKYREYDND